MSNTQSSKAKTPRKTKSARQRAEEALASAERRLKRANDQVVRLTGEMREAAAEQEAAKERRDYAAQDPALKGNTITRNTTTNPASTGDHA